MGFTQKLGLLAQGVYSDSSLNVGIGGAPSGSYKFETTGTAKISSTLLVSGVVTFGSTLSNGTYTYTLPSATGTLALTSDLSGYVPYTGANQTLAMGTNNGITLTDTSSNTSISITSSSTGSGAIYVNKSGTGTGIQVANNGTGFGFYANNISTGYGITIGNSSTGKGLYIDNAAAATGDPFVYTLGGAAFVKAKIDYLGNITGVAATLTGALSGTSASFSGVVSTTSASSIGFLAQTTANSVHPYFRWVANNRSYWAAAIDSGTDATFKIGDGNTIGSSPLFTIDSGTNASTFTTSLSGTSATFSSYLSLGGYLTGQGTNPGGLGASRYVVDFNAGNTRIFSYGANISTAGGYLFYIQSSDGSISSTPLTIASTGAATFSSTVSVGSRLALQPSYFGYSSSYKTLLIGGAGTDYTTNAVTLAFNVDVTANPGGSFGGNGTEYIWRNVGSFKTPNAANTEYNTLLSWNSSGQLTVTGAATFSSGVGINGATLQTVLGAGLTIEGATYAPLYLSNSGTLRGFLAGYSGGILLSASTGFISLNNGGGNVLIGTTTDNGLKFQTRLDGNNWIAGFQNYGSGAYGVRIDLSGSTGSATGYAFRVYTQTNDGFFLQNNGAFYAQGVYNYTSSSGTAVYVDSSGNLYRFTSSLRYKRDVIDYTNGLTELLKIQPKFYKSKNPKEGEKVFAGLIAEQIDEIGLKEFVEYNKEGQPDAVHYSAMTALLVKAIQEQQAQIEALKLLIK